MFTASFMFIALSPLGITFIPFLFTIAFTYLPTSVPTGFFWLSRLFKCSQLFFSRVIIPTPFSCRAGPGEAILSTQSFARPTEMEKDSIPDVNSQIKSQLTVDSLCPRILPPGVGNNGDPLSWKVWLTFSSTWHCCPDSLFSTFHDNNHLSTSSSKTA